MSKIVNNKRILFVGNCVLDVIHVCEEYPIEDTDKRCLSGHWQRGGNASNNCTVLRRLGGDCEFLGVLTESHGFQFLEQDFNDRGILTLNCPKVNINPAFSSVLLNKATGSRTIVHCHSDFPILKFDDFDKLNLTEYEWIHFEARNPDETSQMMRKIQKFNENNKISIGISLELEKLRRENFILTEFIDLVFIGKELSMFMNWKDPEEAVKGLRNLVNVRRCNIICTWGSLGVGVLDNKDQYDFFPAKKIDNIVDTLGAGDTFCAATLFAINRGKSLCEAVTFACDITAEKITHLGYDSIKEVHFTEQII